MIGKDLGPYRVLDKLGEGGMGEVYRARDSNLHRDVAIKVLPELFATDPERLARFTREARTLAALNHPNIATIFGIEGHGIVRALVMELVDGDDLSALMTRGPMPLAEALPIARQMADALEAAHEQGIVHRDLKPANIKVRPNGTVKVLDFGLAKAADPVGSSSPDTMQSPTLSARSTQLGMVLGTAAYMSPEQARGRPVDRRTDIWAFGVILHELLTGTRMFDAESVPETLALIFAREPDLAALPADTPPGVRATIARCLVKDPRQRLRDIGDARLQIEDALSGRVETPATVAPVRAPAGRLGAAVWLALPLVAIGAAAAGWFARPAAPSPVTRLSIALPPGEQMTTVPAISADGRSVAYAAGRTPGSAQLYVRALDDFSPRSVAGSAGAQYPFFSPDGRSLAFFAGGKLRRSSVAGGAAINIASAPAAWGGTWDADGRIVFVSGLGSGLWRVSVDGAGLEQLTRPDGAAAGYAHVFPQRLPGTRELLFSHWGQTFYGALLSADTGTWRAVTTNSRTLAAVAIYSPDGHLLGNDGNGGVTIGRWDPATTTLVSTETPVIDGVHWGLSTERSWLNVSDTGTAVYVPGRPYDRHMVWVDRQGEASVLAGSPELIHQATLSRDGRRVVYGAMRAQWIMDLVTGARTRLVSEFRSWHGGWLPGDTRIVFSSNKDGDWDLYTLGTSGGEVTPLLKRPFAQHVQAVAPDGSIVFLERLPATGSDLWTLAPNGQVTPLVVTPFNETAASVSADGRYVAYVSDESGRNEVFVIPSSGKGDRVTVSIDGGTGPVWSRDGRELFYRAGDDLLGIQVRTTAGLVLGERKRIVDLSAYDPGYFHEFDVSADGQRFLLIRTEPASRPVRLDIILNWFEELKTKG